MKRLGRKTKTSRGFEIVHFKDYYNQECSLQQSSLALYQQHGASAVWLGIEDAKPKVLHGYASKFGIKTDAIFGWVPYPIPPEVSLNTRMHLSRGQVERLIEHLQKWLTTGKL